MIVAPFPGSKLPGYYRSVPPGLVGLLPRSGYTEQPRALALGRWLVKGALKVAPEVGRAGMTPETA
jgi:hypothetical protein